VKALLISPVVLLAGLLATGCDLLSPDGAPLRYIDVSVVADWEGSADGAHGADGAEGESACGGGLTLRVELENVTSLTVDSFRATAYLYAPAPRIVEWRNGIGLPPGERRVFCVDLAPAFHAVPADPPTVDMLHIREVSFEDGSEWRDPLAAYVWRRDAATEEVSP
jgi:hypothetical protein